jgi:hypothetical protein
MLDKLQSADFITHLHEHFRISLDNGQTIVLELVSVQDVGAGYPADRRHPFSLLFLGPESDVYLRQHTYPLQHDQMGTLDLFIVPLGPDGRRMRYEAIFS